MARPSTIENHPKRDEIIAAFVSGESRRSIANRFGISLACVQRYAGGGMKSSPFEAVAVARAEKMREATRARGEVEDMSIKQTIAYVLDRMRRLYDACDEYLRDPNAPSKYDLMPRAWEYEVVYRENEPDTDRMVTKKATLQWLLERIDAQGYQPWEVRMKSTDPRHLVIGTANAIAKQLELLAKLEGTIQEKVEVNVQVSQTWVEVKSVILKATEGHPDVRDRILTEIAALE